MFVSAVQCLGYVTCLMCTSVMGVPLGGILHGCMALWEAWRDYVSNLYNYTTATEAIQPCRVPGLNPVESPALQYGLSMHP